MFITILIFIIILGILVLVHEFGHFYVAKKSGMVVHEFGFGFPPRLVGVKKVNGKWKVVWGHQKSLQDQELNSSDESTLYSINLIPLGGFVRIMGENNEHEANPKSFINKKFWPRFLTLVAGVVMNWVLAALIFSVLSAVGNNVEIGSDLPAKAQISDRRTAITMVLKKSPAEKAGLRMLDVITAVDGKTFSNSQDIKNYLISNKGKNFIFTLRRGGEQIAINVQSLENPGPNEGPTGIAITDIETVKLPWPQAFVSGMQETFFITKAIYSQLGSLVSSGQGLDEIGGPVQIGRLVGDTRLLGFLPLLRLTALLSLSLAILNILPFPALDGGRVLFLIIEKIRGKKNNQKVEQFANAAGFALLLILMIVVTIKDIIKS